MLGRFLVMYLALKMYQYGAILFVTVIMPQKLNGLTPSQKAPSRHVGPQTSTISSIL